MNPYDELGVNRDATDGEIKKAYKKKAQKSHPDRGGSTDDFQRHSAAYALLSDKTRRERYDSTGDTGDRGVSGAVFRELAGLFLHCLDQVSDISRVNIIRMMEQQIMNVSSQHLQALQQNQAKIDKRKNALRRVKREGFNFLAKVIESDIKTMEVRAASIQEAIELSSAMMVELKAYEYIVDSEVSTSNHHSFTSFSGWVSL